ncbi:hypothetical protein JYB64_13275 [Algoriphagus aestuarii]|nr:hypothetical protein [Algoriphagus aestuarii]
MNFKPIFSEDLLSHYISDFRLSNITRIREISLLIKELVEEFESGKIESLKEEEIKSRFINTFFGDILGFNYGNSNNWRLRDEKKSIVDGTKSDAALGFFFVDRALDEVRAVIEIKDAKTSLDEKQARPNKQTPVEQAFDYASKSGGNCKWVIVSNIKEIRFYPSLDRSRCQVFFLKELVQEKKLKELLFLFHIDRFINKESKSSTDKIFILSKSIKISNDKPIHVLDKVYNSLKRFEGFGFVDPNFLSSIFPFNILDDHVWHFQDGNLFSINGELYKLINGVNIEKGEVVFTEEFDKDLLEAEVFDAKYKIEWTFSFLNNSLIDKITVIRDYKEIIKRNKGSLGFSHRHIFPFNDDEGLTKSIRIKTGGICDCLSCNYRNLDFNKLLYKLKVLEGDGNNNTFEHAFGHYLVATNNFKTSYNIYKAIERDSKGKQGKWIDYFLAKKNIKLLHNLILDYHLDDRSFILRDIKSVDLDKVIYDEIEFDVDNDVKKYLIKIKDDSLIYKIQDDVDEIVFKIEKLRKLYENGGKQYAGPNLPNDLAHQYFLLYSYVNLNFIVYDTFIRYKTLTEKVFKAFVSSCHIPKWGIQSFSQFFLTEAILHIPRTSLQEILNKEDCIKVSDNGVEKLLEKLNNYTKSIFKDSFFNDYYENYLISQQFSNHKFRDRFTDIFSNLFTILSRLNISNDQFSKCITPLLKFLETEKELAWYHMKEFSNFLLRKGDLLDENSHVKILKIAIYGDKYGNNKYRSLIESVPKSLLRFYPNCKISNKKLIQTAILNCTSDSGDDVNLTSLIYLTNVCSDECKGILYSAFETQLDFKFSKEFYEALIRNSEYDYNRKSYFLIYSELTNRHKGKGTYKFGNLKLTDLVFINYILTIYKREIDFNREELQVFSNLNEFEIWLLNPFEFDYSSFKAIWLTEIVDTILIDKIKNIKLIKNFIDIELKRQFNPVLAKIKYVHFAD